MITKKRTIGLLLIGSLLTVGIASVYAKNDHTPLDEVWSTITTFLSRIAALEARVDVLEGIGPTYTLRVEIDDQYACEVWSYVNNPSLITERGEEGPLHNVEVQYLRITIHPLDEEPEETDWNIFYPNGYIEDCNGIYYFDGWELRWDATVHPGETALVFWSGWTPPADTGICHHIYEICVEYEGTTYILTNTFDINVPE